MKNQSSIAIGLFLIVLGGCFLILQFFPSLGTYVDFDYLWPLIPLGIGLLMGLIGLFSNPPMLVPGTILSGIGLILFASNTFRMWDFWQLWLLVPAFVGLGIMLFTIRDGKGVGQALSAGGWPLMIGLVLFAVFSLLHLAIFQLFWPVILILAGVIWLFRVSLRGKSVR